MADRFLTTHVGSLPRAADLLGQILAREEGQTVDEAALASRIEQAVAYVVGKQAAAGFIRGGGHLAPLDAAAETNQAIIAALA